MSKNLTVVNKNELIPLDGNGNPKYKDINDFKALIDKRPSASWVKFNQYSQNAAYLPIRIVEELLSEIFPFWEVQQVGEPKILANSIVISVQLKVFQPLLNGWLSYAGVGAVPIELDRPKFNKEGVQISGARNNIDFEFINSKAMHKNVPAALSFAISNAAKKIGKIFGSSLNSIETIKK